MTTLPFETVIQRPIETVFALLADLAHYDQWLKSSALYNRVRDVSDSPVKLGTTYIDQGKSTTMRGIVTQYNPPTDLAFSQTMPGLTIDIRYHLQTIPQGTRVSRTMTLKTGGIFRLLQPLLIRTIKREDERIMAALLAYFPDR